jgi:hypothetical protein
MSHGDSPVFADVMVWTTSTHHVTISARLGGSRRLEAESARFAACRLLDRKIVGGVTDTPLTTFLKLLEDWSRIAPRAGRNGMRPATPFFVFRFEYDDEFLHARHAAR